MINFYGVVEDSNDPLKLGRARVRVIGKHAQSKVEIPTNTLPWAIVAQPTTSPAISGIGHTPFIVRGTHVIGFFRDGTSGQDLIVTHCIPGIPSVKADATKGFNDPSGFYPIEDQLNESDLNRLARNEKIEETIVQAKKDTVIANVDVGGNTFDEPETEYDSTYPFNKVYETESGHIVEHDDTPGKERTHNFHKSGTFVEVYPSGKRVTRIVDEDFEIIHDNKNVYIRGSLNVRIDGDANLKIYGNSITQVNGDETKTINGDLTLNVNGDLNEKVGGSITRSSGSVYNIAAGSAVGIDGSETHIQSGKAYVQSPTKASFVSQQSIDFIEAFPITELPFANDDNSYPDETLAKKGITGTSTIEEEHTKTDDVPTVEEPANFCESISVVTDDDYISKHYKLKDVSSNTIVSKYTVKAQQGLSKDQIKCNLKKLAINILDPIKDKYPNVIITSGFRTGSTGSKHEFGQAGDIQFAGVSVDDYYDIAIWISDNLPVDAILLEYKNYGTKLPWIHISYAAGKNRGIVQTFFNNQKVSDTLAKLDF